MSENRKSRSLYVKCHEHDGYWVLWIHMDQYDSQGEPTETLNIREPVKVALTPDSVDQAWVLLVVILHILEERGAAGRIRGHDWPALPL